MIYGSHSKLVEQGVDTKQLLGLIHEKEKKDEFTYEDDDVDEPEANGEMCKCVRRISDSRFLASWIEILAPTCSLKFQ